MSARFDPRPAIVVRLRAAGCVFAEEEAEVLTSSAGSPEELEIMVSKRIDGLPLEHVVGWVEFCGRRIAVDPGVFVPRRRTELMVREALSIAAQNPSQQGNPGQGIVVVDLCCGCGAVGASVAAELPRIELYAADIDPAAVACTARNISEFDGHTYVGDLYEPLPKSLHGRINILTANTPYVPTEAIDLMPREARLYEPKFALDGGVDGLEIARRVIAEAPTWLAPGGAVLIETSEHQAQLLADLMTAMGLTSRMASSEELDASIVIGLRLGSVSKPLS